MDAVDLESIPSQIGTGIIRIQDQSIIKSTGQMDAVKLVSIFEIFKHSSRTFTSESASVKTVTIQGDNSTYRITSDGFHIYVVLLKSN